MTHNPIRATAESPKLHHPVCVLSMGKRIDPGAGARALLPLSTSVFLVAALWLAGSRRHWLWGDGLLEPDRCRRKLAHLAPTVPGTVQPAAIKDRELRTDVEQALEYQRRIEDHILRHKSGLIRDRLEDTANQITDWVSNIYQLAVRVDTYRQDDLLARERELLPREVEQLTAQRKLESNTQVQEQLDQVIAGKGKHWQAVRNLDVRMRQAALQLEQSLTALGTVYSQVQLIDAQDVDSGQRRTTSG